MNEKILIGISDICQICGVGRATATRMAKACGVIPGRAKGQKILVSRAKFEKWLEGNR
ncbi:MAG: helix-turn-helix domain-containing protein [Bacteroidales bacterium]|nr:helix-turn-helix domain-containing protein [Candidatus Equimonas faecalis]